MSKRKVVVCNSCDELIENSDVYFGEKATFYQGKPLCGPCYHDCEPIATLFRGLEKEPYCISLSRNGTDGEFSVEWKATDALRGRYKLLSQSYAMVFSDSILSYHESETMLKNLNDMAMDKLDRADIDFYRAFTRTSNVFCADYGIWAKRKPAQILVAYLIVEGIKADVDYHNPLYSTGIVFSRDEFKKLQNLLGDKYRIERDSDVVELIKEKGSGFLDELKQRYEEETMKNMGSGNTASEL